MNDYIKNRILIEKQAILDNCEGDDLDEKYSSGLWDWAGEIAKPIKNETLKENIQCEVYYALSEIFETLYKSEIKKDYSVDSMGYYLSDNLTPEQEIHNLNLDEQIDGV